jgi:hypothetical protein
MKVLTWWASVVAVVGVVMVAVYREVTDMSDRSEIAAQTNGLVTTMVGATVVLVVTIGAVGGLIVWAIQEREDPGGA